jgi:toxin HigB-1
VIRSFRNEATRCIFQGQTTPAYPPDIQATARRKLLQLHRVQRMDELRQPPGNRFEALKGDRAGEYSIRINRQWRVVFRWDRDPYDVWIEDYH